MGAILPQIDLPVIDDRFVTSWRVPHHFVPYHGECACLHQHQYLQHLFVLVPVDHGTVVVFGWPCFDWAIPKSLLVLQSTFKSTQSVFTTGLSLNMLGASDV